MSATLTERKVPVAHHPAGQGLLWRRIFHDSKIYLLLFQLSSITMMDTADVRRQKTLAQARILRILPRLCLLDFPTVSTSPCPDLERQYTPVSFETRPNQPQGLLHYAAIGMVDRHDLLMHVTLLDFFRELIDLLSMTELSPSTLLVLKKLVAEGMARDKINQQDGVLFEALTALRESPRTPYEVAELIRTLLL